MRSGSILLAMALVVGLAVARGGRAGESAGDIVKKAKAVLAQIDGDLALPGLKDKVEVLRDPWGVPHIYAKNAHDLFFAQGFVAAQDRLFQLDMWRRTGVGETAEILGPDAIEADRFARLIRYRGDMDAEWKSYSPDTQQIAEAFTAGINACIDHVAKKLPIEFQVLGITPKKWRAEDILGRMSGIIMSRNFQQEIARARLINAVGIEKARLLAPTDPVLKYGPALDLAGIDDKILAGFTAASKAWQFKPSPTASNNWVVDGTRSASGKPMLASDPHRAITVPSLRYLVHLNAPGWNCIGAGEPALPGIALGHNDHIAWGITIVGTDQADIFVETTHPDDPTQYKVGDAWAKMKIEREKILVKGKKGAVEIELRFTRHGPVIYQDDKRQRAYALKWSGSEPGGAAYLGGLAVSRASSWKTFLAALESWKIPALNFVYGDVDGNIGWVATGLTPIRKHDGLLPVPGAGTQYDWQGYLAVKDYPQVFNPAAHWVGTANHNILPKGYPQQIAYDWAPPYRYQVIHQRMQTKKKLTREDFRSIQHENTSLIGQALVRLLKGAAIKDKELAPYIKVLTAWDGVLSRETPAGPLFATWLLEMQHDFLSPHVPKKLLEVVKSISGPQVMLAALEEPEATWFGAAPIEARDRFLAGTLRKAAARTRKLLGDDPNQWSWGRVHTATFHHPLEKYGAAYAKAFNLGPVPRSGEANTPHNTKYDDKLNQVHGASYRHVFDLADWDKGLATSTPGQSGQPGSPHYGDLLPLWTEADYFPMYFSRAKVEAAAKNRLVLKPG